MRRVTSNGAELSERRVSFDPGVRSSVDRYEYSRRRAADPPHSPLDLTLQDSRLSDPVELRSIIHAGLASALLLSERLAGTAFGVGSKS